MLYHRFLTGLRLEHWLFIIVMATIAGLQLFGDLRHEQLMPTHIYSYQQSMAFDGANQRVNIATYLPLSGPRQQLIRESVDAPFSQYYQEQTEAGLSARWQASPLASDIQYQALIKSSAVKYDIESDTSIQQLRDNELTEYLAETEVISVNHPEIRTLWQSIKPQNPDNALASLTAIYDYTRDLENLPFKGTTSALTALRLGAASCNGKSRLFVALARGLGLPSRLVGGVILNQGKKRTSHQWVEVFLLGHWIPFDPTNEYFAEIPAHYLELYRGDQALFRHTSNIQFDYQFDTRAIKVAPAYFPELASDKVQTFTLVNLFRPFGIASDTIAIFLLFPLCALIVTFFRNVVGLQTFGVFVPMLIAITCAFTGLETGLLGVTITVALAFLSLHAFEKARLLKVPRLAATITMVTLMVLLAFQFVTIRHPFNAGVFALFPIVIISFIAERLLQMSGERDWSGILFRSLGTLIVVVICYLFLQSVYVRGAFALYPELMIAVLAAQIFIGRWNGIRLSELLRFKSLFKKGEAVVGINQRNRDLVYPLNNTQSLALAADKLRTKQLLAEAGIPVPQTLFQCDRHSDLVQLDQALEQWDRFALKPNQGSQGNGIVIITQHDGEGFRSASGSYWTRPMLRNHASDIISGSFSQQGDSDTAYLEPLIEQDDMLTGIAPGGLADIRLIVADKQLVAVMLRLPTRLSRGKANLHQGALGVSVDPNSGRLGQAQWQGKRLLAHPDTGIQFSGIQLPCWPQIRQMALKCAQVMPLGYMGIDVCLDRKLGPLVLEINGRPGLEIQNIQQSSLANQLPTNLVPSS